MKNLIVLIGAGASAGSVNPNINSPHGWAPPVTKDIFHIRFNEVLNKFESMSGFSGINEELENGATLESYFKDQIGTHSNYLTLPANRELQINQFPLYLQALFNHVSGLFKGTSYYHRLVNDIFSKDINVTFITLNYDLLLDYAIEKSTNVTLDNFNKYFEQHDKWTLLKLHGSINWFRQILSTHEQSGNTFESWKSIVNQIDILSDLGTNYYHGYLDPNLSSSFKEGFFNNIPYYPALAIPNGEYEMIFPMVEFSDWLKANLKSSENFLFIGLSAYDKDLLQVLKEDVLSVKKLLIVGRDDTQGTYDRLVAGAPIFAREDPASVLYGDGFEGLIKTRSGSSDLVNFLDELV